MTDLLTGITKVNIDREFDVVAYRTVAQQRAKLQAYEALKKEGLPIPHDLKTEIEGQKLEKPQYGAMA